MPRGRRGHGDQGRNGRVGNSGNSGNRGYSRNVGDVLMGGAGAARTQPRCGRCHRLGHGTANCKHCSRCNRFGHVDGECRANLANAEPSNRSNNHHRSDNDNGQHANRTTGRQPYPMAGYTFASCIPAYSGSSDYCPSCNDTTHNQTSCPRPNGFVRLQYSTFTCWKCAFRGHTGDDCNNPNPASQTNRCGVCRSSGHTADRCNNEVMKRFQAIFGQNTAHRFIWSDAHGFRIHEHPIQAMEREALEELENEYNFLSDEERAVLLENLTAARTIDFSAQPQQATTTQQRHARLLQNPYTSPRPHPVSHLRRSTPQRSWNNSVTATPPAPQSIRSSSANNNTPSGPPVDKDRLIALRQHGNKSRSMYVFENVTAKLIEFRERLITYGLLTDRTFFEIYEAVKQGNQFFRDPTAMYHFIRKNKAKCFNCGNDGVIFDGSFNRVEETRDPLTLSDSNDWGLFVGFQCSCSNSCGYAWI